MGYMFSWNKKQKLTRQRARQHRAHMTCTFHVQGMMCQTVLLHWTTLLDYKYDAYTISAQIGLVRTNHVQEFCFGFDCTKNNQSRSWYTSPTAVFDFDLNVSSN